MEFLRTLFTVALPTAFTMAWGLGAVAGVVYWSYRFDHEAAMMSVLVPLYGAITVGQQFLH